MNDYVEVEFELEEGLIDLIEKEAKKENLSQQEFIDKVLKNLIDTYKWTDKDELCETEGLYER